MYHAGPSTVESADNSIESSKESSPIGMFNMDMFYSAVEPSGVRI